MIEYSRILIEQYCFSHNSAKSRRLMKLVTLSYGAAAEASESDSLFLEKAINSEKDLQLREALKDLDDFLFGY